MPGYEVWDLVKVPFPYTNRPVQQRRPALVVAIPQAPGAPELLWVLMVTSAANRGWPGDIAISDLEAAGLSAPSLVRSAKMATIEGRPYLLDIHVKREGIGAVSEWHPSYSIADQRTRKV